MKTLTLNIELDEKAADLLEQYSTTSLEKTVAELVEDFISEYLYNFSDDKFNINVK